MFKVFFRILAFIILAFLIVYAPEILSAVSTIYI